MTLEQLLAEVNAASPAEVEYYLNTGGNYLLQNTKGVEKLIARGNVELALTELLKELTKAPEVPDVSKLAALSESFKSTPFTKKEK